jgi:hypothetical protein
VEDFLRWSPHVRNPSFRKESRLSPGEMVELQKVMASYGDRVGSPGGGSRRAQSEAVARAASGVMPAMGEGTKTRPTGTSGADPAPGGEAGSGGQPAPSASATSPTATPKDPPASAIRPRARRPPTSPKRAATRGPGKRRPSAKTNGSGGDAPVEHYDDLDADEIVTLVGSLEESDLQALLEYERANRARPRVVSAIEGASARRR